MADQTEPHSKVIIVSGIISAVVLIVTSIALLTVYDSYFQKWTAAEDSSATSDVLALRGHEEELLSQYKIDGGTSGTQKIRIPIERAMELEAQKPWRPGAPWPATTPTPMPTATPAAPATATQKTTGSHENPSHTS